MLSALLSVVAAHRLSAKRIAGLTMAVAALTESLRGVQERAIEKAFGAEAVQGGLEQESRGDPGRGRQGGRGRQQSVDDESVLDQYGMSQYAVVFDENALCGSRTRTSTS